jgi:hypothetical protein
MTSPEPPPAQGQFIGWLLIAVGALMVLLCGGCTLVFWGVGVWTLIESPSAGGLGAMGLLFLMTGILGGLPAAGGGVLIWAGWRAVRPLQERGKNVGATFD